MKKQKINQPSTKEEKSVSDSNPVNKFKKGQKKITFNSLKNVINSAVTNTAARTGSGLANEGTAVSYEEER